MNTRMRYKNSRLRWLLFCLLITLSVTNMAWAQFEFPKKEQTSIFEMFGEEKRISVTPNPRYNRIEGLYLGADITTMPIKSKELRIITNGGYGITSKKNNTN